MAANNRLIFIFREITDEERKEKEDSFPMSREEYDRVRELYQGIEPSKPTNEYETYVERFNAEKNHFLSCQVAVEKVAVNDYNIQQIMLQYRSEYKVKQVIDGETIINENNNPR